MLCDLLLSYSSGAVRPVDIKKKVDTLIECEKKSLNSLKAARA